MAGMEFDFHGRWMIDDGENQIVTYLATWPRGADDMHVILYSGAHVDIYWCRKLMRSMDIPFDAEWIYRVDCIDEFTDRITFPDGTIVDLHTDNGEPKRGRWPY